MHTVEALLTASDVTGEARWARYAVRIVERVVHDFAAGNDYRLPEHFTPDWVALPDYNRDDPAHPFRPYGVTIGHLLEWSRLTLQTRDALADAAPPWMLPAAVALFRVAVRDGWWVDGRPGFVYTTDFAGVPVVRDRLHWVVAEGIGAAWALHEATGDPAYLEHYQQWWAHARGLFIDPVDGSWQHELNPRNEPASSVWDGRPDVYHAYQAALLPSLRPARFLRRRAAADRGPHRFCDGPARLLTFPLVAPLAQLAEQVTLNHWVRGSSPWRRTFMQVKSPAPGGRALLLSTKPATLGRARPW